MASIPRLKYRAKISELEFDIDWSDIVPTAVCPVLGIKPELTSGNKGMNWSAPSVDRFDNSKGYIKGNVRVISNRANVLKKDASIEEIRAILAYMEGLQPRRP